MAYFDKEAYARKQAWAERKNSEQSEIAREKGLTEEQTDLLEELCSFRHKMHCEAAEAIVNSCATDNSYWINELDQCALDCDYQEGMRERVFRAFGEYPFSRDDFPSYSYFSEDCYDFGDGEPSPRDYEEYVEKCDEVSVNMIHKINNEIENFLRKIDEKCDTCYCPSGRARIQG